MDFISEDPKDCAALNKQRRREIAELIENRQPFPNEKTRFDVGPVLLSRAKFPSPERIGEVWGDPVGFRLNHSGISVLRPGSPTLLMVPCLAVHPDGSLMRLVGGDWTLVDDDLSETELRQLRIGVQGNHRLLVDAWADAISESLSGRNRWS